MTPRKTMDDFGVVFQQHPRAKRSALGALIALIALLIGGGVLLISVSNTANTISAASKASEAQLARIHNAEACTLKVFLAGTLHRSTLAANDKTSSPGVRKRARQSIPQIKTLLAGQITQPLNLDCKLFVKNLAATTKLGDPAHVQQPGPGQ